LTETSSLIEICNDESVYCSYSSKILDSRGEVESFGAL
jgi:hypothetical protein